MPELQNPEDGVPPNWWRERTTPVPPVGYADMIEEVRILQDRVAAAVPDVTAVSEVTELLRRASEILAPLERDEWSQVSGFAADLPSRGSALMPVLRDLKVTDESIHGKARFGRFHLGGNGAAHGGTIPLIFDDLLGRFSVNGGRPVGRTAYLHVDFRSITPIEKDLDISGWFVSEQGRKRVLRGVLRDGDTVCAEAEGLFVRLNPGQS